jgi:hypothetical protein
MIASLPLVAILGTANAGMSLYIAGRLRLSYREHPQEAIKYFFSFYTLFGVFFLFFAASQLFFLDQRFAYAVGISNVVSYFFLNMSLGYLLAVPYQITNRPSIAHIIISMTFVYTILFLAFRVMYFSPSVLEQLADYVYWRPVFPAGLRFLTGLVSIVASGFTSLFFVRYGIQNRHVAIVMYRSFWLAAGISVLMIAATVAFVVASSGVASHILLSMALVFWGLVLIMRGVMYTPGPTFDL